VDEIHILLRKRLLFLRKVGIN